MRVNECNQSDAAVRRVTLLFRELSTFKRKKELTLTLKETILRGRRSITVNNYIILRSVVLIRMIDSASQ